MRSRSVYANGTEVVRRDLFKKYNQRHFVYHHKSILTIGFCYTVLRFVKIILKKCYVYGKFDTQHSIMLYTVKISQTKWRWEFPSSSLTMSVKQSYRIIECRRKFNLLFQLVVHCNPDGRKQHSNLLYHIDSTSIEPFIVSTIYPLISQVIISVFLIVAAVRFG